VVLSARSVFYLLDYKQTTNLDRPHAAYRGWMVSSITFPMTAIAEAAPTVNAPNSFVQLRTWSIGRRALHAVEDLGDADQILSDRSD